MPYILYLHVEHQFNFHLLCSKLVLNKMETIAYNLSKYYNTTQSNLPINYSQNFEAFTIATLYNRTQAVGSISSSVHNQLIDTFVVYSTVVVSILGGFGHILSSIILSRPPFNELPHALFCLALAFVDLALMIFQINISLIRIFTGQHGTAINRFLCKFFVNFAYLGMHLDAWIIVGLSGERVIAVFWPMRAKLIITKFRIKIFLFIAFLFFIVFDVETSVRYDLVEIRNSENTVVNNCEPVYFYGLKQKYSLIKDQIANFLSTVIPLTIIATCNTAILIRLFRRKREQSQLGVNQRDRKNARTNAMLIGVMATYVVLNFPAPVYIATIGVDKIDYNDSILTIFVFLSTLSVSLNFYMYFFTSDLFRNAAKNLFQFKCSEAGRAGGVSIQRGRADQPPGVARSREIQVPLERMRY